jgi:hypothetical protein
VHRVAGEAVAAHRQEGAGPDVERDSGGRDAAGGELVEQARREMEAGGRRRDRARRAREDRLVALAVELRSM